jgi:flagellar basal body rod protein FlgG
MNAAAVSQNVTAHNIANINTEPYAPKQAIQSEVFPVGAKITVRQGATGTNDLAQQMTDLNTNKNLYSMNAKAIKMQDRMNGELINLVG